MAKDGQSFGGQDVWCGPTFGKAKALTPLEAYSAFGSTLNKALEVKRLPPLTYGMVHRTPKERRDRKRPLKVFVSAGERASIAARASQTRLSLSCYLRNAGLGVRLKSTFDHQAILALIEVNAHQGQLGGRLKLWLSERSGDGAPDRDICKLFHDIEAEQKKLRERIDCL